MKKEEKFPFLREYKINYIIQRIGAINDTAKVIELTSIDHNLNIKLVKQIKKELNEVHRFLKSNLK